MNDSEAVRTALREAATRRRVRSANRDEVRSLAADKRDREEMHLIREQLAGVAPTPTDLTWSAARSSTCRRPAVRASTVLVPPDLDECRAASFRGARHAVVATGERVHVEQTTVVDPRRLGRRAGRLEVDELRAVDEGLTLVLGL